MTSKLIISLAAISMAAFSSADYVFGYSGAPLSLDIELSDGSHFISSTSWSQFDAGVDNQGWWSNNASNYDANDNTIVGNVGSSQYRNFFTFDIANLNLSVNSIISATLKGDVTEVTGSNLTYKLFDVSTDTATLNGNDGTNAAIYNDLGTGNGYGSFSVDASDSYTNMSFLLDANALADLTSTNSAGGVFFNIGGRLPNRV